MLPYWLLFLYFAVGALISRGIFEAQSRPGFAGTPPTGLVPTPSTAEKRHYPLLGIGLGIIILMAGFRYRVGGDWGSYALMFRQTSNASYESAIQITDPGYQTVAWLCAQLGAGVWLVNLICASIFAWGLSKLVRHESLPWLGMLVAIPYLVIVVAMGYTRQAAAIGFMMSGVVWLLEGGSAFRFLVYGILATLFHKTAFLMIPVVLIGSGQSRMFVIIIAILVATLLYQYFVAGSLPQLTRDYIDAGYQSRGAGVRLGLTATCGAALLLFRRRMMFSDEEFRLWRNFAFATFALLTALFIVNSSTVVDRLGLYLFPLQIAVLSRVSLLVKNDAFGKVAVVTLSSLILFIWANYGDNSLYWNPYRMVPLDVLGITA